MISLSLTLFAKPKLTPSGNNLLVCSFSPITEKSILEPLSSNVTPYLSSIFESIKYGYKKILIVTGKGIRSKVYNDPYRSEKMNILKYSVPEYIESNTELMNKIIKIDFESVNSPSKGNFDIFLKTIK